MNEQQAFVTIDNDDLAHVAGGAGGAGRAGVKTGFPGWVRRGARFVGRRAFGVAGLIYDIMEPTPAY